MSIGGKLTDVTRKDLTDLAYRTNINDPEDIIDLTVSVAAEWNRYAAASNVPADTCRKIDAVLLNDV